MGEERIYTKPRYSTVFRQSFLARFEPEVLDCLEKLSSTLETATMTGDRLRLDVEAVAHRELRMFASELAATSALLEEEVGFQLNTLHPSWKDLLSKAQDWLRRVQEVESEVVEAIGPTPPYECRSASFLAGQFKWFRNLFREVVEELGRYPGWKRTAEESEADLHALSDAALTMLDFLVGPGGTRDKPRETSVLGLVEKVLKSTPKQRRELLAMHRLEMDERQRRDRRHDRDPIGGDEPGGRGDGPRHR